METKINYEKLAELFSESETKSPVDGFEKHMIQEGVKQMLLGTGPVEFQNGIGTNGHTFTRSITKEMHEFLSHHEVLMGDIVDTGTDSVTTSKKEPDNIYRWSYTSPEAIGGFYGTQKDWNQTLTTKLNEIRASILKDKGKRTLGIIMSPKAEKVVRDLELMHVEGDSLWGNEKAFYKLGEMKDRFVFYTDRRLEGCDMYILENNEVTNPALMIDGVLVHSAVLKIINLPEKL